MKIYPNPVVDRLTIASPNPSKGREPRAVVITDLSGKQIIHRKWADGYIDMSNLCPGVYVVNVETESGERVQKKVVKK